MIGCRLRISQIRELSHSTIFLLSSSLLQNVFNAPLPRTTTVWPVKVSCPRIVHSLDISVSRKSLVRTNHSLYVPLKPLQWSSLILEGQTVRGCATEWSDERHNSCRTADHCQSCVNIMGAPGCNSGVFPVNRVRCHICSATGNTTACATAQIGAAQLCPQFNATDRCFILRRGETFERGCVSSERVCESGEHCHVCDGHGKINFILF